MPTDLNPIRARGAGADHTWLRDSSGLEQTFGVTLDGDLFGALRFPDGWVPGGTVVAQVSATRLWGPYDPAATDGRQIAQRGRIGHVLDACTVRAGRRVTTSALDSGGVQLRFLPTSPVGGVIGQIDDNVRAALPRVRYA